MNEYAFKFTAQAWRRDPYYVGSSQPIKKVTVVATTEKKARDEARRVLGNLNEDYYWRFWLKETRDVRLTAHADEDAAAKR